MKKLPFGELAFVVGVLLTAAGVALQITADLGLSMIASIAYILSEKFTFLNTLQYTFTVPYRRFQTF